MLLIYPVNKVMSTQNPTRRFSLVLIKPSHYDDDGYVIQWLRSAIPSNTLAVLNGLALDCKERRVLGDDVEMDIARRLRALGVQVCMGGFHVSGCLSMLPEMPPELKEAQDLGISLFEGEAEGRFEMVLRDAWNGELKPLYNYLDDLPSLEGEVIPILPAAQI